VTSTDHPLEDLASFRTRAREFVTNNLGPAKPSTGSLRLVRSDAEELAEVAHDRDLQRRFFDARSRGCAFRASTAGRA
jgi:hypothetical protein